MPVKLITGVPGAGKTLLALQAVLKELGIDSAGMSVDEIKVALRAQTVRPVCVIGVEGLMPGLFHSIEDPLDWQSLEDGTLVLVDEAWKWLGSHELHRKQDPRVLKLAEHRHRGFDFIMTCQQPSQMLSFVRGLVGEHVHVTRKFGSSATIVYSWPYLVDDPNSIGYKERASESLWRHPPSIFGLYQSATKHTIKRKIPFKFIWGVGLGCVALAGAIAAGFWTVSLIRSASAGDAALAASPADVSGVRGSSRKDKPLSDAEWVERFTPRFPGMHDSAPIFDGRDVAVEPRRFCVISRDDSGWLKCTCYTEQVTPLPDVPRGVCMTAARHGEYDYFRAPPKPGRPNDVFQAEPAPTIRATGTGTLPTGVATPHLGDVQGRSPNG